MKNLFLAIAIGLFVSNVNAQSESPVVNHSDNLIKITSNLVDCVDKKNGTAKSYVSLNIENITDKAVSVSFKKNLWYDGTCTSCESSSEEYKVDLELGAGLSLSGSCDDNQELMVFSKMMELKDVRQLTYLELQDVESFEN